MSALLGELHLVGDESVRPVQQFPRRIPIPLKENILKVDSKEEQVVITKVTKPTKWISNIVVVEKSGKIRVCLDPSALNKALCRAHYHIPTIEEVLPSLEKVKIFSVMDAKNGYWQERLDEESSYLTTFWTHKGRYRWTT